MESRRLIILFYSIFIWSQRSQMTVITRIGTHINIDSKHPQIGISPWSSQRQSTLCTTFRPVTSLVSDGETLSDGAIENSSYPGCLRRQDELNYQCFHEVSGRAMSNGLPGWGEGRTRTPQVVHLGSGGSIDWLITVSSKPSV